MYQKEKIKKLLTLYIFINKYNHTIRKYNFRTLPFPAMISLLVLFYVHLKLPLGGIIKTQVPKLFKITTSE